LKELIATNQFSSGTLETTHIGENETFNKNLENMLKLVKYYPKYFQSYAIHERIFKKLKKKIIYIVCVVVVGSRSTRSR
jgi:hypothetical protein